MPYRQVDKIPDDIRLFAGNDKTSPIYARERELFAGLMRSAGLQELSSMGCYGMSFSDLPRGDAEPWHEVLERHLRGASSVFFYLVKGDDDWFWAWVSWWEPSGIMASRNFMCDESTGVSELMYTEWVRSLSASAVGGSARSR